MINNRGVFVVMFWCVEFFMNLISLLFVFLFLIMIWRDNRNNIFLFIVIRFWNEILWLWVDCIRWCCFRVWDSFWIIFGVRILFWKIIIKIRILINNRIYIVVSIKVMIRRVRKIRWCIRFMWWILIKVRGIWLS